jgi:hypothetical protein
VNLGDRMLDGSGCFLRVVLFLVFAVTQLMESSFTKGIRCESSLSMFSQGTLHVKLIEVGPKPMQPSGSRERRYVTATA